MEPYTIAGGNPAREIRRRFSPETIAELVEIRWWDCGIELITRYIGAIVSGDTALLREMKEQSGA